MIVYELSQTEQHPVYQELQISNTERQYSFLLSIIKASIDLERPFLSSQVMKALNFHAITCLHTNAGEYRPCEVEVGTHEPPWEHSVPALMDDFVNHVNYIWNQTDLTVLAAYVLWRLNYIHPFINGNGRTARAICYFVICAKLKNFLPGTVILPELLLRERPEYVKCLQQVDESAKLGAIDVAPLSGLIQRLLIEQINTAHAEQGEA